MLLLTPVLASAAPPNALNDERSVPVNTPITIDVLNNDSDPDGDSLTLLTDSLTEPGNGSIRLNEDGGIQYQPNPGFSGRDQFSYTIVDSSESREQATATVIITVTDFRLGNRADDFNARGVATALEQICTQVGNIDGSGLPAGFGQLIDNCQRLQQLFVEDSQAALEAVRQIAPEETLGLLRVGGNASNFQINVVSERISQLNLNSPSFGTPGLSWSGKLPGAGAGDELWSKVGIFASIQLENADKETTGYETGYRHRSNGFTLGADYAINTDWYTGAAIGWTKSNMDYALDGGSNDSDVYTLLAYSTYHVNNFSVDFQIGAGSSKLDIWRNINYGWGDYQFNSRAYGKTNGGQWFMKAKAQYLWSLGAVTVYPSIGYTISNSKVDDYAEINGNGWDVIIGEQNAKQQTLEASLQATYAINQSWGVLIPNLEVKTVTDIDTDHSALQASFAYAPTGSAGFTIYGEPPQSTFHVIGLGFSSVLPNGGSAFMNLNRTVGYDYYSATQVQFGLRFEY